MDSKLGSVPKSLHALTAQERPIQIPFPVKSQLSLWTDQRDLSEVIKEANVRFLNAKGLTG